MLAHLADRLGLSPTEVARYRPTPSGSRPTRGQRVAYRRLTEDTFEVVSHWYHYAILELTAVESFRPDPRWIARTNTARSV
jgi:hypothetical protein